MPFAARHIAIIAPPTPGHLNPLQVLGAELVALGHRVTIVHVAEAERFVTSPGIGFAALHDTGEAGRLTPYLAKLADPTGLRGLTRMIRATADMTELLLDRAPPALERIGADAVLADSAEPAGPLVARRIDVPHVIAVTGLPLMREPAVPPPFLGWSYRQGLIGHIRNGGGHAVANVLLRPIDRVMEHHRRAWGLDDHAPSPQYVAQCPRELDFPRQNLPPKFAYGSPWRRPSEQIADLPDDDRPLIFCSLGTLQGSRRALFATIAEACASIGARAVIGHAGGLTGAEERALPGDPLVRAFWPQRAVMQRCSAAVLHGGFNSVLDALSAGLPIVTIPIAFEQPGTAARLVRVGAGIAIAPRRASARSVAASLLKVMREPAYRRAASRIAAAMTAADGAVEAAAAISAELSSA